MYSSLEIFTYYKVTQRTSRINPHSKILLRWTGPRKLPIILKWSCRILQSSSSPLRKNVETPSWAEYNLQLFSANNFKSQISDNYLIDNLAIIFSSSSHWENSPEHYLKLGSGPCNLTYTNHCGTEVIEKLSLWGSHRECEEPIILLLDKENLSYVRSENLY